MESRQENLLREYKNLNQSGERVKILVSYIKPSFLFKSDTLMPIHLGREIAKDSSKDGVITTEDLKWLLDNCMGDNDFEGNISKHNRRVGFFTGTYWGYKNYEKLGNPEYFGSFGYRKLLAPTFLEDLKDYDAILPKKLDFKIETIRNQFVNYHGEAIYLELVNTIKSIYPLEIEEIEDYFNGTSGYFHECYILKKELFFKFCDWILPILFELMKTEEVIIKQNDTRDIGFIMERLTGYYLTKLTLKYMIKEVDLVMTEKALVNKANIDRELLLKLRKKL